MSLDYEPRPFPPAEPVTGREVTLEPIVDGRRFAELYEMSADRAFDPAWDYLAIGPFDRLESFEAGAGPVLLAPDARFFAVVNAQTGKAEGFLSLMRIDRANGVVEIGNILFGPALQRTRRATEVFFRVFAHVFDDLGYRRLEWKCNDRNAPSKRAAERLGFTWEGLFRQHMIVKGENRDTAWFSLLDREWPHCRVAFEAWLADANFDEHGRQRSALVELRP
ncbi:GNAT family N-acetyltransferase [Aureimonas mangrovi]|uniref:GNAT family N-acetyltransferase n=1 Tax=Aureimonas mangrovi TaxID=2758041 RepID=UPI00163D481D|nr:GNAT family protein [Aureimonas mangrovi]